MRVEIRRIRPDEGAVLMRTRLLSLLDAPYAFAATYMDEAQQPTSAWSEQARDTSEGPEQAVFAAVGPDGWVGMAGSYTPKDPSVRHLYGMWVEPSLRGQGLGAALVETVVAWARQSGATAVTLWVAETNDPALGLYRKTGFQPTHRTQPMPSDETMVERLMRLDLGTVRPAAV